MDAREGLRHVLPARRQRRAGGRARRRQRAARRAAAERRGAPGRATPTTSSSRVPPLVSFVSSVFTLQPGDLILTGTPSGVGFARDPKVTLKPGDTVEVEIDGIGVLSNPVVSVSARAARLRVSVLPRAEQRRLRAQHAERRRLRVTSGQQRSISPKWWRRRTTGTCSSCPSRTSRTSTRSRSRDLCAVAATIRRIAIGLKEAYACDGISTRQHNEPAGNQDICAPARARLPALRRRRAVPAARGAHGWTIAG